MLLMKLNNKEKFAFLQLAYYIAHIDGKLEIKEETIIEEYCTEMGIETIPFMILIHSDDRFHELEEEVSSDIITRFKISQEQLSLYSQWGKMVSALYIQGKLFIGDEEGLDILY